jgi:hypothetical protein
MKTWVLALTCGLLVGCDFSVPAMKTAVLPIDTAVVGAWQRPGRKGVPEKLLVLPFSDKEYLVAYPAGNPDAMFAKAMLCQVGDLQLVQLQWVGTGAGRTPDDPKVFQLAAYTVKDGTLTVRLVNPDALGAAVSSPEDLVKAVVAQAANPALYREAMTFTAVATE